MNNLCGNKLFYLDLGLKAFVMVCGMLCGGEASAQSLLINEVQVANIDQFIDPSYDYGGWVELYNPSASDVSLSDYVLRHTDEGGDVKTQRLTSSHGKVPAKGFALIWFDHNSKDGYYGPYASTQIPFKLDAEGGVLELLEPSGGSADVVSYPESVSRCSYVRTTDGGNQWGWTSDVTPGTTNNGCVIAQERLKAPVVDTDGGLFSDEYQFAVNIPRGTTLFYTTDGSTPTTASSISRDGKFQGTETTVYRFMLARREYLNSPVVTRSLIKTEGEYTLPVLSVSTAPKNFFDDTIGLYVRGTNGRVYNNSKTKANQNMDWERPVSVEYFVPNPQSQYEKAIGQEATFSIFGGWTRFNPGYGHFQYRSSFKLKSDKVFERLNSFSYPIFNSKPYVKIKNFLVRNGGQDGYARIWDPAIQELLRTSGVYIDCQAWQPAHVFLDGQYLGMMNLREESNKQFAFSNYGIDKDEIDQWEGDIVIKEGDRKMLDKWYDLSVQLAVHPTDTTLWRQISDIVDIDEYCNYMAAEIYMGNLDWLRGGFKNLKGFRAKDGKGKFHIVLHDVDGGFGDTDMILQVMTKGTGSLPRRFCNMLKYAPFKKQFVDAYCIMNGSVFEPQRSIPIIRSMQAVIDPALQIEDTTSRVRADLLCERLSDETGRRTKLKNSLVKAFNLQSEYTVKLSSNIEQASLLLNGQEIPTGKLDGYLFPPIALRAMAPKGYRLVGWQVDGVNLSADSTFVLSERCAPGSYTVQAVYERDAAQVPSPVCINEVSAGNDIYINEYGKKADWLELYNRSDEDVDLAGYYLSDDASKPLKHQITSDPDVSTILPAYGHRVVWCDGKASKSELHVSFKLKNSDGSMVFLTTAEGTLADSVRYQAQPRWYTYGRYPDGGGELALLARPTIATANRWCTSTVVETREVSTDIKRQVLPDGEIDRVRYYNLIGQEIATPERSQVVIQVITYKNGARIARKIQYKPSAF